MSRALAYLNLIFLENVKILDCELTNFKREVEGAIYIRELKPALKLEQGTSSRTWGADRPPL